jgi:hypothetical protein
VDSVVVLAEHDAGIVEEHIQSAELLLGGRDHAGTVGGF